MFFVRRKFLPAQASNKTNEYVAMHEKEEVAEAIKDALNRVDKIGGFNVVERMSWPEAMGAAIRCNQTYLTRPIDRSDQYGI